MILLGRGCIALCSFATHFHALWIGPWGNLRIPSALLLTGFMGFLSARTAKEAAEDADWVTHTYAVKAALEDTLRHVVNIETGARTFDSTGEDAFLEPYVNGEQVIAQDRDMLRHLTADNRAQQMRLDLLEPQITAKLGIAKKLVATRRETGAVAPTAVFYRIQALEGHSWPWRPASPSRPV